VLGRIIAVHDRISFECWKYAGHTVAVGLMAGRAVGAEQGLTPGAGGARVGAVFCTYLHTREECGRDHRECRGNVKSALNHHCDTVLEVRRSVLRFYGLASARELSGTRRLGKLETERLRSGRGSTLKPPCGENDALKGANEKTPRRRQRLHLHAARFAVLAPAAEMFTIVLQQVVAPLAES